MEALAQLPARATVWAIDANGLMVRPGPRVVDGVEALATIFCGGEHVDPSAAVRIR
jgi:iron complex transport system substrate-binding protein